MTQLVAEKMIVALKNHDAQMIEVIHDKAKGKMKMCNENGILKMNTEEITVLECADNASLISKTEKMRF